MNTKDPKGYYKVLAVDTSATEAQIKAAYKKKAMELHPDRNKAKDATQQFQLLTEAFNVLSNPDQRAEYDTPYISPTYHAPEREEEPPEPAICSVCNKVSAQPRYAIFYDVRSFILYTSKKAHQGVFCSSCAEKKVLQASLITWLFGWWGFPWGPIYSVQTLFINLFGGKHPNEINARLTFYQAWVFAYNNKLDVAYAIAQDSLRFAKKLPTRNASDEVSAIRSDIVDFIDSFKGSGVRTLKFVDSWRVFNKAFYIQASAMLIVAAIITNTIYNESNHAPPADPFPAAESLYKQYTKPPVRKPVYERPFTDPNGNEWPSFASYLDGYPQLRTNGLSKVTVDNSRNDSDVFVKLVAIQNDASAPVRTFYIQAKGSFTLENITPGEYDLRYRDLDTGKLSRSESFVAKETPSEDGVMYSVFTMTLYKVSNGNMHTFSLDESEF